MSDSKSYWDEFNKAVEKEFGGGGVIAKVRIETGFKVYADGMYGDVSWFPTRFGEAHEAEKNVALIAARELGRPVPGTQIKMFREGAISRGKLATWNVDQFKNVNQFDTGFKKVLLPSLVENGIEAPWEGFARIGWQDDPHFVEMGEAGMKDEDQNGEARFPRIAYVVAVLTDAEYQDALNAAGGTDDAGADVLAAFDGGNELALPKLFQDSRELWESTVGELAEKVGGKGIPDVIRLANFTKALTEGDESYVGYTAESIEVTPQLVLDWANQLGV